MVIMAQSAVNWHHTHTPVDRTRSLTHLQEHSCNHMVRSACTAWNKKYILKVPEGGGSKPEYLEKTPDSLPANQYHILEDKIQRLRGELNPHPPTLELTVEKTSKPFE